ncbi:MAG: hypothetical protein AAFP81_00930 [Pseudomonadota bacterium]
MKTASAYFMASMVCIFLCMVFADFGWRIPYVIGAAWLSAAFLAMASAALVVDAMYRLEELRLNARNWEKPE